MRGDKIGGPIRWRIVIPVARELVFAALNSDEGRASYWAESAVESDDRIEFQFVSAETYRSRILQRTPPEIFAIEYFGGPVTFTLSADGAESTDLLLTHDGVSADDWIETHAGWLNVLFPLKARLAHGIDFRNHDRERSWDRGYAD
ncbi:MAG: hypothetical protein J5I65_16020 [Aridibacter famidurans]|nr:hypothetical protein [Aridibacter famidurans]